MHFQVFGGETVKKSGYRRLKDEDEMLVLFLGFDEPGRSRRFILFQ